jgi:hypothetical protein
VALTEKRVLKGRTAIITTIMIGKMEMVLPVKERRIAN